MIVLAIESTCDETSAAVVRIKNNNVEVLSNVVASSAEIHEKYGGVVPEVAAREQIMAIIPVIKEALRGITPPRSKVALRSAPHPGGGDLIDAIAVAVGPGLVGSLLIGVETAKTLALIWKKPLIPINHMTGHIMANWINETPKLPAIALVVSGGHTDLVYMKEMKTWKWIGGTRDDAAGECLDKSARILGLGYPGGPAIQKAAMAVTPGESIRPPRGSQLPRPMIREDSLDLSFSGLKSALSQAIGDREKELGQTERNLWAREVNRAMVDVLVAKTLKAIEIYQPKSLLLAGGVAANKLLRERLNEALTPSSLRDSPPSQGAIGLYMPELKYCGDNAAMIGAACLKIERSGCLTKPSEILQVRPEPGLETG